MILVVGSTGILGTTVCLKLAAAGKPVRGLVRDTTSEKARRLAQAGVTLVTGDLKDRASLDRAVQGVRTVICTASSTLSRRDGDSIESVDRDGVTALIAAAAAAGVQDFIHVSFDHAGQDYPLALAKRAAEGKLKASRLNWTILQPACFSEIWLSPAVGFDVAGGTIKIYGEGDQPMHYIAIEDVARAVVASVGNAAASRKVFRFGGGSAASQLDAVKLFERATGRKLAIERMSLADIRAARAAAPDTLTATFLGLFEQVALGFKADPDWQTQLGGRALTLEEWVQRNSAPAPAA